MDTQDLSPSTIPGSPEEGPARSARRISRIGVALGAMPFLLLAGCGDDNKPAAQDTAHPASTGAESQANQADTGSATASPGGSGDLSPALCSQMKTALKSFADTVASDTTDASEWSASHQQLTALSGALRSAGAASNLASAIDAMAQDAQSVADSGDQSSDYKNLTRDYATAYGLAENETNCP